MTRKERAIERLYNAVANYVRLNGGTVAVIGGIQIQRWPNAKKYSYTIGVQCTGKLPKPPDAR